MRLVNNQYVEIRKLKENLPLNHVVAQLDFSENYTCTSMEEFQSAYWNQSMVTIHPVVIHVYYKSIEDGKETLHHKSFTIISDELSHTASTVFAFLKQLLPLIKVELPKFIHYVSVSPKSQYRNKFVFDLLTNHQELFGNTSRQDTAKGRHTRHRRSRQTND